MSITPNTKTTFTLSILGSFAFGLTVAGWTASKAFGEKVDRAELGPIRSDITNMQLDHREDRTIQKNILAIMEKMDARMERIENNQAWQIQEEVKRRQWQTFKQEPPATPPANVNK